MNKLNDFERLSKQTLKSIDNLELMPNKMLVKFRNLHQKTVGGIETNPSAIASNYAAYSDRSAIVIKPPSKLTCSERDPGSMLWECDIDVASGDEVWFDATESLHSQKIECNKEEFAICDYSAVVLAKRKQKVIVCNGYVLLEVLYETEKVLNFEKRRPLFNYGIVRYLGKPNKRYRIKESKSNHERSDEGANIKVGDKVFLDMPQFTWSLEDWCFAVFDNRKMYKVAKRYMIAGIINDNLNEL